MDPEKKLLVGVAGWSYDDWKDVVYPAGKRRKLAFMSRYVDCIEINTSFYRPVSPGLAEKMGPGDPGPSRVPPYRQAMVPVYP